jgi:hypothetical protein
VRARDPQSSTLPLIHIDLCLSRVSMPGRRLSRGSGGRRCSVVVPLSLQSCGAASARALHPLSVPASSLSLLDSSSSPTPAGSPLPTPSFLSSLERRRLLIVDYRIKVHMDLQADKSPVVIKGPFFPRVVNPRYRIRGTMCNARIQSSKARIAIF